jgi:hypothetical protein
MTSAAASYTCGKGGAQLGAKVMVKYAVFVEGYQALLEGVNKDGQVAVRNLVLYRQDSLNGFLRLLRRP